MPKHNPFATRRDYDTIELLVALPPNQRGEIELEYRYCTNYKYDSYCRVHYFRTNLGKPIMATAKHAGEVCMLVRERTVQPA